MCRVSDVSGIFLSFQMRIGRCLEGEKTQWWSRAGGCSTEFGMSCLGSILHNIYTKTHASQPTLCQLDGAA